MLSKEVGGMGRVLSRGGIDRMLSRGMGGMGRVLSRGEVWVGCCLGGERYW